MGNLELDKASYDLIRELRRSLPDDEKSKIRLADPELLQELVALHQRCKDSGRQGLIEQILTQAGASLPEKVQPPASKKTVKGMYRGQPVLVESRNPAPPGAKPTVRAKRIYRGQVIEG